MLKIKVTKKEATDIVKFLKSIQVPADVGYNLVVVANLLEQGEEIEEKNEKSN